VPAFSHNVGADPVNGHNVGAGPSRFNVGADPSDLHTQHGHWAFQCCGCSASRFANVGSQQAAHLDPHGCGPISAAVRALASALLC
jgi:hypothetical protein